MSVVSVRARGFILALFIRDDGKRFLLGDNGYDFKDSQLHFSANSIENDEVVKQGADGVMLAGQVRRASVQSFDGYVGDATMPKETIEQMRRDFFAFFVKGHHFRVVYVDTARNAWQRKGGYLVDAPEVKELYQVHPEYHVGLNFEDVNYYSYNENSDGDEILANSLAVPVSTDVNGGLVWDNSGATSTDATYHYGGETADATPGKTITISDAAEAPLASFRLDGETSQNVTPTPSAPVQVNTVTGDNVVKICGKNLFDSSSITGVDDGTWNGSTVISNTWTSGSYKGIRIKVPSINLNQEFTISMDIRLTSGSTGTFSKINDYVSDFTAITRPTVSTEWQRYVYKKIPGSGYSLNTVFVQFISINGSYEVRNIQIEYGGTTDYEASKSQSYEVNLGKNLFNGANANAKTGYILNDSGTEVSDNTGGYTRNYSAVKPNTTYTISGMANAGTRRIYFYNGTKTFLSRTNGYTASSITFTTPANCYFVNVQIYTNTDTSSAMVSWQIELGSQATSYAAYFEPIELCKIGTYQDYIYKSGDKWYVHKEVGKVILDGVNKSFSDRYTTSGSHYRFVYADQSIPNYTAETVAQIYCDKLIGGTIVDTYRRVECVAYNDASNRLIMYISSIEDYTLAAANTWLESNSITVYYVLATPTDTEITNQALITQLDALLNNARTYAGVNNIFTVTQNEQGTLEIGYYTEYQPVITAGGYVWEVGGEGGPTTVINNSIDDVAPIWTVKGPTLNPTLENATTGEQIEYVGMIAQGQTLTIDMGEQTASLDGLNVISNVVGDYISLAPGANTLLYSVTGTAGASEIGWSEIVG